MFTKKYIKKCEKAKELQELWKPKDGDYFYGYEWNDQNTETKKISEFSKKEIHLLYFTGDDWESCFPVGEEIGWHKNKPDLTKSFQLFTQEQLQKILLKDYSIRAILGGVFYFGVKMDLDKVTMNEIWLDFFMYEKYQKIWVKGDWEKDVTKRNNQKFN